MSSVTFIRPSRVNSASDYLTFAVGPQMFAVRAVEVRDVLRRQTIAPIPRAPDQVAGLMNLRGHIVTALDLHVILSCPKPEAALAMSIVVEHRGEPFCLMVDRVGEVLSVDEAEIESNPASMPAALAAYSRGVVKAGENLVLILELAHLFSASRLWAAA